VDDEPRRDVSRCAQRSFVGKTEMRTTFERPVAPRAIAIELFGRGWNGAVTAPA
jgi:hypothetical protein